MNTNQSLIIYKFPVLFNILNEIKSYLNFNIENLNDDNFDENFLKKNLVIISGEKKKNFQKQVKIDEFPINIEKLNATQKRN